MIESEWTGWWMKLRRVEMREATPESIKKRRKEADERGVKKHSARAGA